MEVEVNVITTQIYFLKMLFMSLYSIITALKLIDEKKYLATNKIIGYVVILVILPIIIAVKNLTNSFISTTFWILSLSFIFSIIANNSIGYSIVAISFSFTFNHIIFFVATISTFIINRFILIENDYLNLMCMAIIQVLLLYRIFNIKKLKYGISFLQKHSRNEYIDTLIINISVIALFFILMFSNKEHILTKSLIFGFIMLSLLVFVTIHKFWKLYYKHKLLIQNLNETKEELDKTKKELENANQDNIRISKKSHTLDHRQKSLQRKLNKILQNAEISEEIGIDKKDLENRVNNLSKEIYTEVEAVELTKTGIIEIDDMLEYMQSECIKDKIEFDLQISGNIYHMTNELIAKEDLEILLADHIKNAIIAINHSENSNRSILVKLGKIDNIYSLYIYDSGIEFEKEILENLGKVPSTTHADEGGTGMGFMNTFDTLKRTNASLTIEEIGKPSKENYTKVLIIKFDKKHEFQIKTYKQEIACNK